MWKILIYVGLDDIVWLWGHTWGVSGYICCHIDENGLGSRLGGTWNEKMTKLESI